MKKTLLSVIFLALFFTALLGGLCSVAAAGEFPPFTCFNQTGTPRPCPPTPTPVPCNPTFCSCTVVGCQVVPAMCLGNECVWLPPPPSCDEICSALLQLALAQCEANSSQICVNGACASLPACPGRRCEVWDRGGGCIPGACSVSCNCPGVRVVCPPNQPPLRRLPVGEETPSPPPLPPFIWTPPPDAGVITAVPTPTPAVTATATATATSTPTATMLFTATPTPTQLPPQVPTSSQLPQVFLR